MITAYLGLFWESFTFADGTVGMKQLHAYVLNGERRYALTEAAARAAVAKVGAVAELKRRRHAQRDEFSCPCCGVPNDSSWCPACTKAECGERDTEAFDRDGCRAEAA